MKASSAPRVSGLSDAFAKRKKLISVILLIVVLSIIGELVVGGILTLNQGLSTLKYASYTAMFALCQMIVIAGGGNAIDLSVGYVATLSAIFGVAIMNGAGGLNFFYAILVAILVGGFFGMINGALVSFFDLSALVVTMSMSSIVQGVINVYTAGTSISGKPSPILRTITVEETLGIPNIVLFMLALIVIMTLILSKTELGPVLRGVGENSRTAYLSGANVKLRRFFAFAASGAIAGLIGLMLAGNMNMAFKDMGSSYVMPSYAAVVVGGVALKGGETSYIRVYLGAVFLQLLSSLFIQLGGGDALKWFGYGTILYVLLLVYASERRKK